MNYFSTCIPGLQEFAGGLVKKNGGKILETGVGALLYEYAREPDMRYFNNTFGVLLRRKKAKTAQDVLMSVTYEGSWIDKLYELRPFISKKNSFRIVTQTDGKLVPVNRGLLEEAEYAVRRTTDMRLCREGADIELWAVAREGKGFFLLRLTRHKAYEKTLRRGELRPDMCEMMIELANVNRGETVLDPFCGHGAIPKALLIRGVNIIAGDINGGGKVGGISVRRMDALKMPITGGSVDCIITDPPWGEYAKPGEKPQIVPEREMLLSFVRVLKPGGRMVILTSRKQQMMEAFKALGIEPTCYEIHVSGKKSAIFKACV